MWPQYTYLALTLLGLGVTLANHGESHPDYNFFTFLIATSVSFGLLYAGGFFKGMF